MAGREVRIDVAPGGVDVSPHDAKIEAGVLALLGAAFDLDGFTAWAAGEPTLARVVATPASGQLIEPNPFAALVIVITAQQVSPAAAAIRSRFVERFGVRGGFAFAFPTRSGSLGPTEDEVIGVGFSTRKAEHVFGFARSELDLDELAVLPTRR